MEAYSIPYGAGLFCVSAILDDNNMLSSVGVWLHVLTAACSLTICLLCTSHTVEM